MRCYTNLRLPLPLLEVGPLNPVKGSGGDWTTSGLTPQGYIISYDLWQIPWDLGGQRKSFCPQAGAVTITHVVSEAASLTVRTCLDGKNFCNNIETNSNRMVAVMRSVIKKNASYCCDVLCFHPNRHYKLSGGSVPRINSRTERPRKPKICRMVARQASIPWTQLEIKMSKVKVTRLIKVKKWTWNFWPKALQWRRSPTNDS